MVDPEGPGGTEIRLIDYIDHCNAHGATAHSTRGRQRRPNHQTPTANGFKSSDPRAAVALSAEYQTAA